MPRRHQDRSAPRPADWQAQVGKLTRSLVREPAPAQGSSTAGKAGEGTGRQGQAQMPAVASQVARPTGIPRTIGPSKAGVR